jgi:Flp pilus assembly protein TadB
LKIMDEKKPQQAGVFSDKKNYFLASLAAGAAAAGLASFFGSSFLAGAA